MAAALRSAPFATTRLILVLLAIAIPLAAATPTAAALFVPVIVTPHDLSSSIWR
jgi:hypothetical protein